jgi:hypothetical protein
MLTLGMLYDLADYSLIHSSGPPECSILPEFRWQAPLYSLIPVWYQADQEYGVKGSSLWLQITQYLQIDKKSREMGFAE